MRKSSILSIAFAVVLGAAFSVPAQAEERLPDFDQGVNVGRFVKNARSAVASDETKLEGESRQIQAMNEGDIVRKIVVFRKGSETGRRMNIIRQTGGIPQKNLWLVNAVSVVMPKSRLQSFKRGLASFGEVLRVEAAVVALHYLQLLLPLGIAHLHPQHEAVHLRFWKRVGALVLDRVLRREDREVVGQRVEVALD